MIGSVRHRDERVRNVRCDDDRLSVDLMDGRTITVPLIWYPNLYNASPSARASWEFCGGGYGIHWPEINEDLITEGLLQGEPVAVPVSDVREIRTDLGWVTIGINEALDRRSEAMRCPECQGRVVPHRGNDNYSRSHFEHGLKHTGCSTTPSSYSGKPSLHADTLQ